MQFDSNYLRLSSVLIQPSKTAEVFWRYATCIFFTYKSISIRRISNNNNLRIKKVIFNFLYNSFCSGYIAPQLHGGLNGYTLSKGLIYV